MRLIRIGGSARTTCCGVHLEVVGDGDDARAAGHPLPSEAQPSAACAPAGRGAPRRRGARRAAAAPAAGRRRRGWSRMKSASTRFENEPADAAMSSACSAENACAGLVSMAPAMNMPMFSRASSSSVWVSSQCANEISSRSFACGCVPRAVGVDLGDEGVELVDEGDDLLLGRGRHREDLALEPLQLAVGADVDVLALAVARVGLEAEVVEGLDERVLVGRDPLAADLEHGAVDVVGPEASAGAVAGLEHDDRAAGVLQSSGGGEAGCPGAHDHDVAVDAFHVPCFLSSRCHAKGATRVRRPSRVLSSRG